MRHRDWLHTALIAPVILLAYGLAALNSGGIEGLLRERLEDILIGCGAAFITMLAVRPSVCLRTMALGKPKREVTVEPRCGSACDQGLSKGGAD